MSVQRRSRRAPIVMNPLDAMAEERIRQAQQEGVFENLPGTGAPLDLDDDPLVPEELRAAYRILKNSGFVPAEVEALRELREVEQAITREKSPDERSKLAGKLGILLTRAGALRGARATDDAYYQKIAEKLSHRH
jgi:hypothetical protein